MKTYTQILEELDEATGRQRVIGALAAGALAVVPLSKMDKTPRPIAIDPKTNKEYNIVKKPEDLSSTEILRSFRDKHGILHHVTHSPMAGARTAFVDTNK